MRAVRNAIIFAACASLLTALGGCKRADAVEPAAMVVDDHGDMVVPARSPLRTHLRVETIGAGAGAAPLELPAAVEPDPARVVNILAPLSGRVTALNVRLGDRVRRGQVLAVIASGDLAQADADVVKAKDAYRLTSEALARSRGVAQAGGAAQKDLEAAESADNQARAELDRANTRLASLNGSGSHRGGSLVVVAPWSGVVTTLSTAPGAQVNDTTATLMTVANLDRVFVTANVAEGDVGFITRGAQAAVSFTAYPGQVISGSISEINAVLEPDTRRQKVRIALDNPGWRLMPNMYATVTLPRSASGVAGGGVFVPQSALLMNNDEISVFVEVRPWVFQRRVVKIGEETETQARVLSGLSAGERVVVRGGVLLND